MNTSTWDKLVDAFGDDSSQWRGKRVKIHLAVQSVRGEDRQIIYGSPYREPQQALDPKQRAPVDTETMTKLKALPPEAKQALMKELSTS
jgi:hypothetical protein